MDGKPVPERHFSDAILANDRLLKALISLLVVERPERLEQLKGVFDIARQIESPIGDMPEWTWSRIRDELDVIAASFGPELH
jgi:hypothetical protein